MATFVDLYEHEMWAGPSMATCRARQKAAMDGRCHCGKLRHPASKPKSNGMGRTWISCERCFGTIKQLS